MQPVQVGVILLSAVPEGSIHHQVISYLPSRKMQFSFCRLSADLQAEFSEIVYLPGLICCLRFAGNLALPQAGMRKK